MWFDSWGDIGRVLAVGAVAYVTLVLILRLSGKRTLAKLNAFDLVVTVALGSTLATILLSADVSWAEGATALALLTLLQLVVAWTTTHLPGARSVVTARPTLLLRDGELLRHRMAEQRVTEAEVRQAVRSSGSGDLSTVAAVVLESDGTISVIPAAEAGDLSALADVPRLRD
ncbi:DUF421 domain-containing protein [Kineosporiaceae bacterium SCSIO 59966]|nr:DUF421 domain-containing protein [Kineosporiaceae bacterium SCSIO 59966]